MILPKISKKLPEIENILGHGDGAYAGGAPLDLPLLIFPLLKSHHVNVYIEFHTTHFLR